MPTIGLRKTSNGAAGIGYVEELRDGGEYGEGEPGVAYLCVRMGEKPKPKKSKKGDSPLYGQGPRKVRLHVPSEVAQTLKIGQKVRVTVTPA